MSSIAPAVEVRGLNKHFGSVGALNGVDLKIASGEAVTIFGPNGAGKTTLMRIVATLARPTSGSVCILGSETASAGPEVRRRIGLVTHQSLLYGALSAFQNVAFFARMFGVSAPEDRARDLLVRMGLEHRMDDPVATFSRGMEQRCAIARALVHDPDLLLLDEPFSGLDPDASGRLLELIREADEGNRTVLLTSHDLRRGTDVADRVAILAAGRLAHFSTVREIPAGGIVDLYRAHTGAPRR